MPSFEHEALLVLLRSQPALAVAMVRDLCHVPVPSHAPVRVVDADFTQVVPAGFHADVVVQVGEPAAMGVIVEHQRAPDSGKRYSWPLYAAALHAQLRCPVCLLVVTTDERVARWAARPIETLQPGSPFAPLVVGPRGIPRVTDAARARQVPELAVLSALAHGNRAAGLEVVLAALDAAASLDDERVILYCDLILGSLNEATRQALEAEMQAGKYEYQSDFARRYFEQGREEGRLEATRSALSRLIAMRLSEVPQDIASCIEACQDVDQLLVWLDRVGAARSAADIRAAFAVQGMR